MKLNQAERELRKHEINPLILSFNPPLSVVQQQYLDTWIRHDLGASPYLNEQTVLYEDPYRFLTAIPHGRKGEWLGVDALTLSLRHRPTHWTTASVSVRAPFFVEAEGLYWYTPFARDATLSVVNVINRLLFSLKRWRVGLYGVFSIQHPVPWTTVERQFKVVTCRAHKLTTDYSSSPRGVLVRTK